MSTNLTNTLKLIVNKTKDEWKKELTDTQFKVLRLGATEPRGIKVTKGGWDDHFEKGGT